MNIAVIRFPGTNCEFDTVWAFEKLGASPSLVWHKETSLPSGTDMVVVPGGFSYGDYLRSGAIARFSPVMKAVVEFAEKGGKVLGICNGFQILLEVGLLPGAMKHNANLHFVSKLQTLKLISTDNVFLKHFSPGETVEIPIAHAEGNYYIDHDGLKNLQDNGQILARYVGNPNGSVDDIAGICNESGNVYALMPHPERAMQESLGSTDGVKMLQGFLS